MGGGIWGLVVYSYVLLTKIAGRGRGIKLSQTEDSKFPRTFDVVPKGDKVTLNSETRPG